MSIISIPNTFSAGAVIVASQHNANFSAIFSDYNGFIDNTNISSSAAIAYSKLNLSGSISNSDINSSAAIVASKIDLTSPGAIGSTAPNTGAFTTFKVGTTNQGDILYDNGTSIIRLTPGTSGQFLKTQGSAANPVWANNLTLSNVLFQYSGQVDIQGTTVGEVVGTSITPSGTTGNYRFLQYGPVTQSAFSTAMWTAKFIKFAGISTVTVYGRIWGKSSGGQTAQLKVDIGGQNATMSGTNNQNTPEWKFATIDVSSLTNATTYDVTATMTDNQNNNTAVYCSNIIGFGS